MNKLFTLITCPVWMCGWILGKLYQVFERGLARAYGFDDNLDD